MHCTQQLLWLDDMKAVTAGVCSSYAIAPSFVDVRGSETMSAKTSKIR
ncbi:unnamed protein product [Heligmosomoides polygyrus]|uniref:Phosphopyruvate hydratase n=1 Tax=Heligmosomoides polygyrus TaxID=6339 RepID=A0A183FST1_HELPZ|nr:unnamed protein product [Heligmosomoides polygyrus]